MKLVDFIKAFDLLKAKAGNETIKDWFVLTSDLNSDGKILQSNWEKHCEWRKPETKDGKTILIPTDKDDLITWSAIAALEEEAKKVEYKDPN